MGKVISFSKSLKIHPSTSHYSEESPQQKTQTNLWMLFEEEKFFVDTIKKWPCFSNFKSNTSSHELLNKYCNNLLSEDQECAIDFMLHIHDPTFVFDLSFSLKKWSRKDRDFFLSILKKHSESLCQSNS